MLRPGERAGSDTADHKVSDHVEVEGSLSSTSGDISLSVDIASFERVEMETVELLSARSSDVGSSSFLVTRSRHRME